MKTTSLAENQRSAREGAKFPTLAPANLWHLQGICTPLEQSRLRQELAVRGAPSLDALVRAACKTPERAENILAAWENSCPGCGADIPLLPYWEVERLTGREALPWMPLVLAYSGNPEVLRQPRVAIIGSRHPTFYGRVQAERFARELSRAGITILSGGAIGIDTIANATALEHGASAAILGSGIASLYPPSNAGLFSRMQRSPGGLILSEFQHQQHAERWTFPRRNLTIAALADFVLVVEASERSGSRHTVEAALDLGFDVGALPGPVDSPTSAGTNAMIRDGAFPITTPDEILVRLTLRLRPARCRQAPQSDTEA